MRLHRLVVTAFGPFAGTVDIDLDEVAEQGLFLIRGATGAGKTSLLDAVAFALYADVPGARSKKGLPSDHAPAGSVPRVTLELTAAGRRLRLERSPEFRRPKARGSGETAVPAKASLSELTGGGWQVLSTRHDEIADVVQDVLGLGLRQFSTVALLPQGDFATFLRASPEDRRLLLERLFDVSTYAGLEEWFAQRRKACATEVGRLQAALSAELGVLTEVLAGAPGDVLEPEPPAENSPGWSELAPSALPAALDRAAAALDGAAAATLAALDTARLADTAAAGEHSAAERLLDLRRRGAIAQEQHRSLLQCRTDHDAAILALEAATRAASVQGDLKALRRADDALEASGRAVASAVARVGALGLDDSTVDGVGLVRERLVSRTAALDEASVRAIAVAERSRRRAEAERHLDELERSVADATAVDEEAARALTRAAEVLSEAQAAAAGVESAARAVDDLERLHTLRVEDERGARQARCAAELLAVAREHAQELRATYQDLRQAELDGMAAQLAAGLESGLPCPVCGSAEHPEPARLADRVTAEAVAAAETAWREAEGDVTDRSAELAALRAAQQARAAQLGDERRTVDELAEALAVARSDHAALVAGAARGAAAERAWTDARSAAQQSSARVARARDEVTAAQSALSTLEGDLEAERTGLGLALADHDGCPCEAARPQGRGDDLATVRQVHDQVLSGLDRYAAALEQRATAAQVLQAVTDEVRHVLLEAGFDSVDAARAALLPAADVQDLRRTTTDWELAVARAQATLDDPDVQSAVMGPAPDVAALAAARDAARAELLRLSSEDVLIRRTVDGLERARHSITTRSAELAAALEQDAVVRELADALGGGGSNTYRMRLSSFVLAARLEAVVSLANERLASMGDGRYQLRHTDGPAARGARSGLGLEVLDLWTGQARETSSLSGGESFMASLALALGLADAVREESGGFELQTLFVDEGFGTLDDESLEQVMEVLDGLREGGRAVGVVSHVAELRSRIPSQVVVSKTERGSTVRLLGTQGASPAA